MTASSDTGGGLAVVSRRERARAATLAEIKDVALRLMRDQGTTDVRFTDIARVMGLTAPALYRYYADRDELLTDMITDGYHDLAAALAASTAESVPATPFEHLHTVASAYRAWAVADPQRFALLFGLPVPGYAAPEEGPTVEAAQRAMANLEAVVHLARAQGALGDPLVGEVDAETVACMKDQDSTVKGDATLPPALRQAMIHGWAALHGFVVLETYGHLDWFTPQARDGLFRAQVDLTGRALGLTRPAS